MTDPYQHSNRGSHCKFDAKSKEGKYTAKPLQRSAKLDETKAKKQTIYFHSRVEQVVRFLKDGDWC
jgi:hypothetical protein